MTPKSFEEIKENIKNLEENDNLEENISEILADISNIEDSLQQTELYAAIIEKRKEQLISKNYENEEELKQDIENFRTIMTNANLKLEELLYEKEFTFDNIIKERQEKGLEFSSPVISTPLPVNTENKKEIDIIKERIAEIEDKYLNLARYNVFKIELKTKLEELDNNLENTTDEEEFQKLANVVEELEKDIATLDSSDNYLAREEIVKLAEKYDISVEEIENTIKTANPNIKEALHSVEQIDKEITELEADLKTNTEELNQIDKEIAELESGISKGEVNLPVNNRNATNTNELKNEYEELKKKVELAELNPEDCMYSEFNQDKKKLEELEKELANLPENKKAKLMTEYEELKKKVELAELNPEDCMYSEFNQDKKRLEELEKELVNLENGKSIVNKKNRLEELKERRKTIVNTIDEINEKINDKSAEKLEAQELLNLKAIKKAYDAIFIEGVKQFENSNEDEDLLKNIEEFVKTHPRAEKFNHYERKDKLINELISDIHNQVRNKKVTKTEEQPKLWIKALAGATGFVVGLGASCVPGVGTIRMTIAGAKLATAIIDKAINVWTKKFPDGKIAKISDCARERFNDSWIGKKSEWIREKLKNPIAQWAINGFSAGYIAGNIYELVKGETLWNSLKPDDIEPTPDDLVIKEEIIPEPVIPEIEVPDPGDVLDLSGLEFGRISSDAKNAVHLMEGIGKEVEFDKIKILSDGTEMWHFKQLNGQGFAWFTKEEVMNLLKEQAATTAKKATMHKL